MGSDAGFPSCLLLIMYNIRQFKPVLYLLLLLGIFGFSLASQSAGTFALGSFGILLNAWLVHTGRFVPMPRLLANAVTLAASAFVALRFGAPSGSQVILIGQFLVFLQLVKIWEQRANRDYAQLLVLSLLLMVAAAISTASMLFGVLLILYLVLSLYCCLLFHLKVETDGARAAFMVPEEKVSPESLRHDQRFLHRSMRKLTGFVSMVAVASAVAVFLFFPRGTGAGVLGPLQMPAGQALTGFSDQMGFQKIAQIQQNHEIIAYLKLWKNGVPVKGDQQLLLRGTTLDRYTGSKPQMNAPFEWIRSPQSSNQLEAPREQEIILKGPPVTGDRWKQSFKFRRPTGTATLFAMPGVFSLKSSSRDTQIRFTPRDGFLQAAMVQQTPLEYTVESTGDLNYPREWSFDVPSRPIDSPEMAKIEEFARKSEVCGVDETGKPLASLRNRSIRVHELDDQIAMNIERYLRSNFSYTLDLTDARDILEGQDPMVAFLYDLKRGHCEYFAGAMTLMCQQLGMQARVVSGFKVATEDYNPLSDCYEVRQSHAHAWVEVKTTNGWKSYDPTASTEATSKASASLWSRAKHFFNYLEFTYANAVIGYDNENQGNLISSLETRMTNSAIQSGEFVRRLKEWMDNSLGNNKSFWIVSSNVLIGFVSLLALLPLGLTLWWFFDRWRLRRRAIRIGLVSLPPGDQLRLARQLGFYYDLLRLLERHGINRRPHMTPKEFAESLDYLPGVAYMSILRMTDVFYRIRYGAAQLKPGQHRRLVTVLNRIAENLTPGPSTHSPSSSVAGRGQG